MKWFWAVGVSGSARWGRYSGQQLEYALFVHSLCLLGKVLLYKNGRRLFPIKVRKRKGTTLQRSTNARVHGRDLVYSPPQSVCEEQ